MWRFIQEDPIGTKDDINLYRYVANNALSYTDRFGLEGKPVLMIYAERGNWWLIQGHAWIEIAYRWETASYWLWPKWEPYPIWQNPDWSYIPLYSEEWVNQNIEMYKKDIMYNNYTKLTVDITEDNYAKLMKRINIDLNSSLEWWIWVSDYWVCSAWASDIWNSVVEDDFKLNDRNLLFISNPNTLADSIESIK